VASRTPAGQGHIGAVRCLSAKHHVIRIRGKRKKKQALSYQLTTATQHWLKLLAVQDKPMFIVSTLLLPESVFLGLLNQGPSYKGLITRDIVADAAFPKGGICSQPSTYMYLQHSTAQQNQQQGGQHSGCGVE
jgi:hypothetical protein